MTQRPPRRRKGTPPPRSASWVSGLGFFCSTCHGASPKCPVLSLLRVTSPMESSGGSWLSHGSPEKREEGLAFWPPSRPFQISELPWQTGGLRSPPLHLQQLALLSSHCLQGTRFPGSQSSLCDLWPQLCHVELAMWPERRDLKAAGCGHSRGQEHVGMVRG